MFYWCAIDVLSILGVLSVLEILSVLGNGRQAKLEPSFLSTFRESAAAGIETMGIETMGIETMVNIATQPISPQPIAPAIEPLSSSDASIESDLESNLEADVQSSLDPNRDPSLDSSSDPMLLPLDQRPGWVEPPTDLIFDDGEPLESNRHRVAMNVLIDAYQHYRSPATNFYAAGNMFVYYSRNQAMNKDFRGPDFFVVLDVDGLKERQGWVVWEEDGRYPDVIVELMSRSTKKVDTGIKKELYDRIFKTTDYFVYDPFDPSKFQGWHLSQGHYQELVPNDRGWLWSEKLGLWLGSWYGTIGCETTNWPRFYHPNGDLVLLANESEKQRAESEKQRAESEKQRAESEKQRAEFEAQKAETERLRAESEKQRAEFEAQKAETERLRAESEKQRAEFETQKAETERLRAESEKQRAESEAQKAEAERQRSERLAERLRELGQDPDFL